MLRPLNFSLANANPASDEKKITETVMVLATIAELMRPLTKMPFWAASTRETLFAQLTTGQEGRRHPVERGVLAGRHENAHTIGKIDRTMVMTSAR